MKAIRPKDYHFLTDYKIWNLPVILNYGNLILLNNNINNNFLMMKRVCITISHVLVFIIIKLIVFINIKLILEYQYCKQQNISTIGFSYQD